MEIGGTGLGIDVVKCTIRSATDWYSYNKDAFIIIKNQFVEI